MKSILDKNFRYVKVADQGPGYLQRKFEKLRRECKANAVEAAAKVQPLKPRLKART